MEYGGHPGYPPTNGVPHGLPGGQGPPPPHHEQHQQYAQPEGHHVQYASQQQSMYPPPGYGPMSSAAFAVQRKKQMRATQACEQCRQRKQKCDEGVPCSFCKENQLSCQYRDTPPAKTDKNMERLLNYMEDNKESLEAVTTALTSQSTTLNNLDARLRRLEHSSSQAAPSTERQVEPTEELVKKPGEHRTAPHKLLLLWPSVQPLLKAAGVTHNDGYVMQAEDRGILRLFTRGEGIDEHDGTQPGGPASPARSDDNSNESASVNVPTPDALWGTGFRKRRRAISATVTDLHDSYMRHIHVMHPFLDRKRLKNMVNKFSIRYSPDHMKQRSRTAVVALMDDDSGRAVKRQRSNGAHANGPPGPESLIPERSPGNAVVYLVLALGKICQHTAPLPAVVPDNMRNANSVVAHQLTGGHGVSGSSPTAPGSAGVKPSPISPSSTPAAHATPPTDGNTYSQNRSRRSSVDASPSVAGPRNLDVIPGLAYYAKAAEILGDQSNGNDLIHAQMFLLAGLYKGQLARVKESMSWITMAGRAVLSLLDRYKLYNNNYWTGYGDLGKRFEQGQRLIKDRRHNMIVLASWTCLQLESDILAELPLPSSRIQDVEQMLLMPHNMPEDETYVASDTAGDVEENAILVAYVAQMFLRRKLNQVHRQLYGSDYLGKPLDQVRELLRGHESILGLWRQGLPPALRWDDDEEPARDILSARLRAKYWGARYVVNRPFLDYALHIMPHIADAQSNLKVRDVAKDGHNNPRDEAEIHLFEAIAGMHEKEIWQACTRCIGAAMQSTIALDGVPNRLVVTNIHGTAHAQFGNMLVLAATSYSNILKFMLDEARFRELLARTIAFLRKLSAISPTCAIDCLMLERIQTALFHVPADQKHVYMNEGVEHMSAAGSFSTSV
ncbi:hypothetical protein LTR53_005800 [Teratosphaeriaceae sp. CCFEE 6253]|nr:hypothetical protein LTR53_005800 [Teratosphaeriaceae sp. CCFEE 6253]